MACYKSALIDLDSRWGNKGQDMKEVKINGKIYYQSTQEDIDRLPPMNFPKDLLTKYQPDRLRRVDTGNSEAIVGSANIHEIAELGRNDQAEC